MRRPALAALFACLFALAAPLAAQSGYTDTPGLVDWPGAERVPALLEAYNAGSPGGITAAVAEHFTGEFAAIPAEQHVAVWTETLQQHGPMRLLGFRSYDPPRPEQLVAICEAEVSGGWHAFVLFPEAAPPHRFGGMQFAPARRPSFLPAGEPLSGDALVAELDALVDKLVAHDMFSGSVVVAHQGEVVYSRAAGLASRRFDVPNRLDTRFNLGSMNKMFTAVTVASLVEDGKLGWTDTVGRHLPDWPDAAVRDTVQVRHLLSHTSGLGNHFTREFMEASKLSYREPDDYHALFADEPLAFAPGAGWSYSNAAFYVLGAIIEAASGQSYFDAVRAHVHEPAGMADTDAFDMDLPVKNLAIGYTRDRMGLEPGDDGARWLEETGGWRNNLYLHSIKGGPAGGGFSTAPDLVAFAEALTGGALVSSATFDILTSPKPELGSPGYGYGFAVGEHPVLGRVVGHSGGFPGINANLDICPDSGWAIAVMANMDGAASALAERIRGLIAGS